MLEKPEFKDEKIINCLRDEYGLNVKNISFLPLGADLNTAAYRVITYDNMSYFVKLRRGECNRASIAVPNFLGSLGIQQIIPSLTTQTGHLWATLHSFTVILYPFVEGKDGFESKLSKQQWVEFGTALKQFHTTKIPSAITRGIRRDNFSPQWRDTVKMFLERLENETLNDPVSRELAAFLTTREEEIRKLVKRADRFAQMLQEQSPECILCHADIHGWNLLIDPDGALHMVDWDTLIFAPKERDLMFIGAGLGDSGYTQQEEETMFYEGYGHTKINQIAIAYYRFERILEDIAVYCEHIFLSAEGGEDRKQSLEYLKSNFLPNGTIERAYQSIMPSNDNEILSLNFA
jgi:spectinomycin phosphotransferase